MLLSLALAATALAGPPNHPRTPADDITGLNQACGAAVDSESNIYASSAGEDKIKVFDPEHNLLAQITNANDPCGLAVDSHGSLLVSEQSTGNVVLYVPDTYPLTATPTYSAAQPIDSSGEAKGISIDPDDDTLFIAKGDRIEAYSNEAQQTEIINASGGSFKLRFEGQETASLPHNASAAEVEAALEGLAAVGSDNVSVSIVSGNYRISFIRSLGYTDVRLIEISSSLTPGTVRARVLTFTSGGLGIDEAQQIVLTGATGGTFKIKFEGEETAPIPYNAPAAKGEGAGSVEAALEGLASIAPGDISIAGSTGDYVVRFEGAYAAKDVPEVEVISALLPNEVQKVTVNATAGAYTLAPTTATATATTTLGSKNVTGVGMSFGAFHVGDAISGPGIPLGATIAAVGSGTLELSANATASGAGVALSASESTAAIAFDAFASAGEGANSIEAALEALPGLDTADVSVTGGPGGPGGANPYLVTFEGAYGGRNVAQMSRKQTGLTGTATVATTVEGAAITVPNNSGVSIQGWSGRIGEGEFGEASGVGAYTSFRYLGAARARFRYLFVADAETDEVKIFSGKGAKALKPRRTIASVDQDYNPATPDQAFGFGPAGTSVGVDAENGHFLVFDAANSVVDELDATGEFLDQIGDPALDDAEPAGLAVRPQWSEVQQIEIQATGGSFRLGFEGAETNDLTVPVNNFPVGAEAIGAALEALPTIGQGNIIVKGQTLSGGGTLTISFTGDLGDRNVELMTADGSGLTGGVHTASVTTENEGSGPGQLYVGVGAGPGAKLLAFRPLVTPTRPLLPELSHVMEHLGVRAVATDSYGDVYVSDQTTIHVFSPQGVELTSFADANKVNDLALDSEGNVYVREGIAIDKSSQLTYYTPSEYPPTAATEYTRHEPVLLSPAAAGEAIAINPANDHLFVGTALGGSSNKSILEFGSAKEGSPGPLIVAPFFHYGSSGAPGIDVYGANGNLYAADSGANAPIVVMTASEPVGEITSDSCLAVELLNPSIAVDQSNGHVLEFIPGQTGNSAREFDASGACVAEFGTFSSGGGRVDIAVDNACATHRNELGEPEPLTETTTPTCEEFDPSNGTAYVAYDGNDNAEQPYDVSAFGPLSYGEAPNALTGLANALTGAAATLNGTVDPRGFELEECRFEYLAEDDYQQNLDDSDPAFEGATSVDCAESPEAIGNGTEPVSVHADISGLSAAERYRFRLLAGSQFGGSEGQVGLFGPPLLSTNSPLPILYSEATVRGAIDPSGLATKYHVEYGTSAAYGQSTALLALAPGDGAVAVKIPLTGLAAGTEYHFRLVAENEAEEVKGPDQILTTLGRRSAAVCANTEYRTGLSANLPDCRAYELVTPADTHGAPVHAIGGPSGGKLFNNWLVKARGEGAGESVGYFSGTLPGFDGTGENDGYRGQRSAGAHPAQGWTTEFYGPSYAQLGGGTGVNQEGIGADQRFWLWSISPSKVFENTLARGHYLRTPIGVANPECNDESTVQLQSEFELVGCGSLGVDPDAESRFISAAGHVVFFSKEHLEADAPPSPVQAVYDRAVGTASAEVVSVPPAGASLATQEEFEETDPKYVGASEDGSAILFSVGPTLYLHRAGQSTAVAEAPYAFAGVSEDGTRVLYIDATVALDPPPATIFACDVQAGPCLGAAPSGRTQIAANSIPVNVSPGGSSVYFSSEEALTSPSEENDNGEHAEAGERNLYAWDGSGTVFIAILTAADFDSFGGEELEDMLRWPAAIGTGEYIGRANSPTRSTPDGGAFVFQSHAQLTDFDNEGKTVIYRFAPAAPAGEQLTCVSCDPTGAPPGGEALLQVFGGRAGGNTQTTTLIPNVTDDGETVFFQSPDRLLPEDANQAYDVYEWKANGAGEGAEECKRSAGCLALISSGQGEQPSLLYGMSADGHDVFFTTNEKLVGADVPSSDSIYDARVQGGIPDPPLKAPCQGDACQGQGTGAPAILGSPASAGNLPDGNAVEPPSARCPKGKQKVRREGKTRCVSQRHKPKHRQKKKQQQRANANRGAHR